MMTFFRDLKKKRLQSKDISTYYMPMAYADASQIL